MLSLVTASACCFLSILADLYSSAASRPRMDASDEVLSQLFPHQQEALAWMVQRENSNGLPPFWSAAAQAGRGAAAGGVIYTNTLTNFETSVRPEPLRWGV
jgi:SWI/SNF-related matrix-associated actin-dependent regulator of chromatin subfamily A3